MDIRGSIILIVRVWCVGYVVKEGSVTQSTSSTLTLPGIETGSQTVVQPTECAKTSHWSSWINRDKPETGTGDTEEMTREEKIKFCPTGNIVTAECQSSDGTPYYDTMDIVDCNPVTGVTCDNDVNMGQCADYMIRYQCGQTTCGVPAIASAATPPGTTPELSSTTLVMNSNKGSTGTYAVTWLTGHTTFTFSLPVCQNITAQPPAICETVSRWSMWIDRLHPTVNTDEHEFMTREDIMRFCACGVISKVECQTTTGQSLAQSPEFVTCSKDNGLACSFLENFPMGCQDYRLRYECQEQVCQTPTAHPQTRPGGSISPTANPPTGSSGASTAHPTTFHEGLPSVLLNTASVGVPTASSSTKPTAQPPSAIHTQTETGPGQSHTSTRPLSSMQFGLAASGVAVLALFALIMMVALFKKYRKNKVAARNGTEEIL